MDFENLGPVLCGRRDHAGHARAGTNSTRFLRAWETQLSQLVSFLMTKRIQKGFGEMQHPLIRCSPKDLGSATLQDLRPHSPLSPPPPRVGRTPPKSAPPTSPSPPPSYPPVPCHPSPSAQDRRVCLRGLLALSCIHGSRPSETQLSSHSLPARRSARFRPPRPGRSAPQALVSPRAISPSPRGPVRLGKDQWP
jgi:hypothetical protein